MTAAERTPWGAAALAGLSAVLGLVLPDVYPAVAGTDAMLRGYDLVTVIVIVPGLAASLLAQRRRASVRARLVEISLLTYLAYTYAYYVLGTGFTELMLLHAVTFTAALIGLVLALARVDTVSVAGSFAPGTHVRPAALILALLSLALGAMWVFYSVHATVTDEVPAGSALVETDTIVHLGIVLDLTLLVPLYAAGAVLLWRRAPWGYVLAFVALVSGLLHQVSYLVALAAQYIAGVPGAVAIDAVEPVIILLYAAAVAPLLRGLRRARSQPSHPYGPSNSPLPAPRPATNTQPHEPSRRSHAHAR
jgi:hypothetical protein